MFMKFVYTPTCNNNEQYFFSDLSESLLEALRKYENYVVIGDTNIDTLSSKKIMVLICPIYLSFLLEN